MGGKPGSGVPAGTDEMVALAAECEAAAQSAGFEPEGRPFHAHVTIARIRPPASIRPLVEMEPVAVTMDVTEITLFRSILRRGRPVRYEVVDTVAL